MNIKEMIKQKRVVNVGVTAGLLVAVVGVMYFGFNGTAHASTMNVSQFFNEKEGLVAQGLIEANEVNINSKVPGRVVKVYVEEGQQVKQGDPLVEISSDELQAKKQQAEAAVAQAEAALKAAKELHEQAKAGVEASKGLVQQAEAGVAAEGKVNEASAGVKAAEKQYEAATAVKNKADNGARSQEVVQAQTAYDLMKASYDRVAVLAEKGAVSQQKLDEIKAQLTVAEQTLNMAKEGARIEDKAAATATSEQAKAGLEASKTRVDQAQAGLTAARAQLTQAMAGVDSANALLLQASAGVEAKEGLVSQAKGALAEVQAYLDEVIIKAPIDGTVTTLNSKEGELVSTGTQIGIVGNLKDTWAQVSVKETELANIKEGGAVVVKVPAYKDQVFTGTVSTINAEPSFAVKRATNENGDFDIVSFGVKIKLDNVNETLRPGMSAYIQFTNENK
nr:efflux RND transporter periplasmic adaptor subunit [uncultured Niameybacter sp.]